MIYIGTIILIVGAVISYFQWRTAQQKVAFDLFDRRYAIYEDLRKVVSQFLQNLELSNEMQAAYMEAQNRARFYFGAEVEDYLENLRKEMLRGQFFDRYPTRVVGNVNAQIARLDRITGFYAEIDRMFIPYMRNDQRMPLWWWSNVFVLCKRRCRATMEWLTGWRV
jgi:hypothetical protein